MTRAELIAAMDAAGVEDNDQVAVMDLASSCPTDVCQVTLEEHENGQRTCWIEAE